MYVNGALEEIRAFCACTVLQPSGHICVIDRRLNNWFTESLTFYMREKPTNTPIIHSIY
jgi:hypothetical protein